jgi:hypothetical protein
MIGGALLLVGLFMTWYVVPNPQPNVPGTDVGNAGENVPVNSM